MIDVNAFIGPWAFSRLDATTPKSLEALLRGAGVTAALVSPLPALLHPDPLAENLHWLSVLRESAFYRFAPIVNASLRGGREDLERYQAAGTVDAVRLTPGCHGYSMDSALPILTFLGDIRIPVIIQLRVRDARVMHPLVGFTDVGADEIVSAARRRPETTMIVAGAHLDELGVLLSPGLDNLYADFSHAEHPALVRRLITSYGADRLVCGTQAPLLAPLALTAKLDAAHLSEEERDAITRQNIMALGLRMA